MDFDPANDLILSMSPYNISMNSANNCGRGDRMECNLLELVNVSHYITKS